MSLESLPALRQLVQSTNQSSLEVGKVSDVLATSTNSGSASFLEFIMSFINQMLILMIDAWYSLVSVFS